MPRKPKIKLKINSVNSLVEVLNDIYDDIQNHKKYILNEINKIQEDEIELIKIKIQFLALLNENSKSKFLLSKLMKQTLTSFQNDNNSEKKNFFNLEDLSEIHKIIRDKRG